MKMKTLVAVVLGGITAGATAGAEGPVRRVGQPIRDEYVVVLKDGAAASRRGPAAGPRVASVTADLARLHGATVERVFEHALRGFSARMTAARAAALAADPRVSYVEEDGAVRLDTTETDATWGIDRIDQRALPLSTTFSYTNTLVVDESGTQGTTTSHAVSPGIQHQFSTNLTGHIRYTFTTSNGSGLSSGSGISGSRSHRITTEL